MELIQKDLIRTYKLAKLGVETHLTEEDLEILDFLITLFSDLRIVECICQRTYLPLQKFISKQDNIIFTIRINFGSLRADIVYELLIDCEFFKRMLLTIKKTELEKMIIAVVESLYVKKIDTVIII